VAISYSTIQAEYQALVDVVDDSLRKAKAGLALAKWVDFSAAADSVASRGPSTYTIMGRSFAFRSAAEAQEMADREQAELEALLGLGEGGTTFVDMGGTIY